MDIIFGCGRNNQIISNSTATTGQVIQWQLLALILGAGCVYQVYRTEPVICGGLPLIVILTIIMSIIYLHLGISSKTPQNRIIVVDYL